jgi:hypothetical protein
MASAGQGQQNGIQAYSATDPASLSSALEQVLSKASGELGLGGCDDSCISQGCNSSDRCDTSQSPPVCVPDVCKAYTCSDPSQFCRDTGGTPQCFGACTEGCPQGQACVDGSCVADNCHLGSCTTCPAGQAADVNGTCQPNQCGVIQPRCPSSAPFCDYNTCHAGAAQTTTGTSGSTTGGATGSSGSTGGTTASHRPNGNISNSGCGCQSAGADLAGLALLALGLRRRSRSL